MTGSLSDLTVGVTVPLADRVGLCLLFFRFDFVLKLLPSAVSSSSANCSTSSLLISLMITSASDTQ